MDEVGGFVHAAPEGFGAVSHTHLEEKAEAPFVPTYDASGNQTLIKTSTGIWTVVYNAADVYKRQLWIMLLGK